MITDPVSALSSTPTRSILSQLGIPGTRASPDDPTRYIAVAFSTIGDGNPESDFTQALGELFDAVMTTLRWTSGHNGDSATSQAETGNQ